MAFSQDARPAREPIFRVPAVVVALIGVLAAAHAARVLSPISDRIVSDYALVPALYSAKALEALGVVAPDLWSRGIRLFSSIFLHANVTHLIVNCLWLLVFGPVIARRFGSGAFLLFFILCGLAGSAMFVALNWGQAIGAIGASGAISGLMGGAVRMMDIRQPNQNVATLPLQPLYSRQVLTFTAIWMVVNFIAGYFAIGTFGAVQTIAWQDHMGGYVAGLLLAGPFEYFLGPAVRVRRAGA